MIQKLLLTVASALLLGGWVLAQQQQISNHGASARLQEMEDASCPPSSDPSGGG